MWKKVGAFQMGFIMGLVYGSIVATLTSYAVLSL
jgi:hypothetical protein